MMNQSEQHGRMRDVVSESKRHADRTRRFTEARLSRRLSERMSSEDSYRAPSLFTWRF